MFVGRISSIVEREFRKLKTTERYRHSAPMIVIDIETTGLEPSKHCMVSLGAVHFETGREFYAECRIYADSSVSDFALQINGFTRGEITDPAKPYAHEILNQFISWASVRGDYLLGGQNLASFDVQFLQWLCREKLMLKWPFGHRYVDLHSVAYSKFGKSMKADDIYVALGMEPEPAIHNALNGAIWCAKALKLLAHNS